MPKISKNASTVLSIAMAVVFIATLLLVAVTLPGNVYNGGPIHNLIADTALEYFPLEEQNTAFTLFLIWCYCVIAVTLACCVAVLLLLFRIRKGLVFTAKSVSYIRFTSWGCLVISAAMLLLQYIHPFAVVFPIATAFLGICLRVVKNVIETATELKNKNDLTV